MNALSWFFCSCILFVSNVCAFSQYDTGNKGLERRIKQLPLCQKIPKKIHQIWVGPKKIPKEFKKMMRNWQKMHPSWEYKLWTEKDIEDFPWHNKELFLKAKNPAMKADIWRCEILYEFGGLYLDIDFQPVKPFDWFHERLAFYAGYGRTKDIVSNALIASSPKHPLLLNVINAVHAAREQILSAESFHEILATTGPRAFGSHLPIPEVFVQNLHNQGPAVLFPQVFFYLWPPKLEFFAKPLKKDVHALHHSACTWRP